MDPALPLSAPASSKSQGSVFCSVCLEGVSEDGGGRSIAKLNCGHFFHLDCIGSAFNAKGRMQCPNCRHVEQGQWLYANGCFSHEDFVDDFTVDEEEIYTGAANLQFSPMPWCPHQGSHLSFTFEELDNFGNGYLEPAVNMRAASRVCPYLAVHGLSIGVPSPHTEDLLSFHLGHHRSSNRLSSRRGGAFHAASRNLGSPPASSTHSNVLPMPYEGTSNTSSNSSFPQANGTRQHNFGFFVQSPQSLHARTSQSNGGQIFGQAPAVQSAHPAHSANAVRNGYMGSGWRGQEELNIGMLPMQVPSTDGGSWPSAEASSAASGQPPSGSNGVAWVGAVENRINPWTARIYASQPSSSQWWAWIPHASTHHNHQSAAPANAYQTEGQFAAAALFPRPRPAPSMEYSEQRVEGPYAWAFSGFHGM